MATLKPTDFIKAAFVDDLGRMIESKNFYLAFMIMGAGIEFLGRCITEDFHWGQERISSRCFSNAINNLSSLRKYSNYLKDNGSYDLYGSLRCGMLHSGAPEYKITLSSQDEREHLVEVGGRLNLKCEDFFHDFKDACLEVIRTNFSSNNAKMLAGFIEVPGTTFNVSYTPIEGESPITGSLA